MMSRKRVNQSAHSISPDLGGCEYLLAYLFVCAYNGADLVRAGLGAIMGRKLLRFILEFGVAPTDRYGMRSKKAGNVIVTLGLVALAVLILGPIQIIYG